MRGICVAAAVCVGASGLASAGALGLPVEIVETFDRFTPGVSLSQQAAVPGCPVWSGGGLPVPRPGSASDIVVRSEVGAGSYARTRLAVGVFAGATVEASARGELFVASIASTASMRMLHVGGGFTQSQALWGGSIPLTECGQQGSAGSATSTFVVTEICPGSFTSARFVDTNASVPVGAWFRLEQRTSADGVLTWVLDLMDGSGPRVLSSSLGTFVGAAIDEIRFAHTPGITGESMFVDNVRVAGLSTRPACPGDATRNGVVNFGDLNVVLSEFGQTAGGNALAGDVNGDGIVNFADLNETLSAFGTVCGCTP